MNLRRNQQVEAVKLNRCKICGRTVTGDEVGLSRKLINRNTTEFLCLDCMSVKYVISVEQLQKIIERYREAGCTLFR